MCVNVEFLLCDFVLRRGRGRREKEGYSAHLIQKLAMACLNLKASQPEVNIFAFHFDSNDQETEI